MTQPHAETDKSPEILVLEILDTHNKILDTHKEGGILDTHFLGILGWNSGGIQDTHFPEKQIFPMD